MRVIDAVYIIALSIIAIASVRAWIINMKDKGSRSLTMTMGGKLLEIKSLRVDRWSVEEVKPIKAFEVRYSGEHHSFLYVQRLQDADPSLPYQWGFREIPIPITEILTVRASYSRNLTPRTQRDGTAREFIEFDTNGLKIS